MNYIECINEDYKSTRKESFYGILFSQIEILKGRHEHIGSSALQTILFLCMADLQLDVKGCRDVYASFDKYVEVERLEGDNKYHAEQYGLQVSFLYVSFLLYISESLI